MEHIFRIALLVTSSVFAGTGRAQVELAALAAGDGAPFENFGRAVAIGGNHAAVGAPNHGLPVSQCGAVYTWQLTAGGWVFDSKLQAPVPIADDLYGYSLSMDGERLAVGVRHDDQAAVDAGAVIVYQRGPAGWVFEAKLVPANAIAQQAFGQSVSLSGSRLAIGAVGLGAGATYIFVRNGATWSQETVILAPVGMSVGQFGERTSLSGDRVAIGARATNSPFTHAGAAFTYTRNGTAWNLEASLTSPNAQPSGEFGGSVALVGASLLVGASNENSAPSGGGRVYAYSLAAGVWTLGQTIVPPSIASNDRFGWSIAMVRGYAVIGCLFRDLAGFDSGAAFAYQSVAGAWTQVAEFAGSNTVSGDTFGSAVAVSDRHFLVGAESANVGQGQAYLFHR